MQRTSEEDDVSTDGEMDDEEIELAEANKKEGDVAPTTKKRMKRSEKKEREKKVKLVKTNAKSNGSTA